MTYSDPVYRALLPLLIFNTVFMTLFIYFAISFQFKKRDPAAQERLHNSFLGFFFHSFWFWLVDPIVKLFAFLRMTPNTVTSLSIFLSIYTGYIFATGNLEWAGWLVIISGTFDLLDGRLARLTGKSTQAGAFYDACMDRYSDALVYSGIALYFITRGGSLTSETFTVSRFDFYMVIVVMILLMGTGVMGYAKARAEAMNFTTKRGLMQRPERVALLGMVMVLYPFFSIVAQRRGYDADIPLVGVVILMTVLVNYSAIVRVVVLFRKIRHAEKEGKIGQP